MSRKKDDDSGKLEEIDENLRRAYQGLLNEAMPERFTLLLEQLRDGKLPPEKPGPDEDDP